MKNVVKMDEEMETAMLKQGVKPMEDMDESTSLHM
jgi:hypothetical protein